MKNPDPTIIKFQQILEEIRHSELSRFKKQLKNSEKHTETITQNFIERILANVELKIFEKEENYETFSEALSELFMFK